MAEIPELKNIKGLPISFKLLTAVPVGQEQSKNLFFFVKQYQGFTKAEAYYKNYSKIINWDEFKDNE